VSFRSSSLTVPAFGAELASASGLTYTTTGTTYRAVVPGWAPCMLLEVIGGAGGDGIVTLTWNDLFGAGGGVRTQILTFTSTQQIRQILPVLGTNVQITIQGRISSATGVAWNLVALPAWPTKAPAVGLVVTSGGLALPGSGIVTWSPNTYANGGLWYLSITVNVATYSWGVRDAASNQFVWSSQVVTNNVPPTPLVLPDGAVGVIVANATAGAGTAFLSLHKAD
jgi:hypothetical protein